MGEHHDGDDRPLTAEAMAILSAAVIADLRADCCDEPGSLVAALQLPIPQLPDDPELRASLLHILLLESRDRERRWQDLCFPEV